MEKPLGTKAYGHIPHLPDSRMGPGDHKVPDGVQSLVCERLRTNDSVTVTEKTGGDPVWNRCVSYLPMESLIHGGKN